MKRVKELLLIAFAAIYGVFAALFSSTVVGVEDYDKVVMYGFGMVAFFMGLFYGYFYYQKKRYKGIIYFAYSMKDANIADVFRKNLRERGYKCLPDTESYKLGDNIYNQMERDLSHAKALLVIVSNNSKESQIINHSIKIMKKRKKKILPITVGEVRIPGNLYGILSTEYDPTSNKTLYLVLEALGESV